MIKSLGTVLFLVLLFSLSACDTAIAPTAELTVGGTTAWQFAPKTDTETGGLIILEEGCQTPSETAASYGQQFAERGFHVIALQTYGNITELEEAWKMMKETSQGKIGFLILNNGYWPLAKHGQFLQQADFLLAADVALVSPRIGFEQALEVSAEDQESIMVKADFFDRLRKNALTAEPGHIVDGRSYFSNGDEHQITELFETSFNLCLDEKGVPASWACYDCDPTQNLLDLQKPMFFGFGKRSQTIKTESSMFIVDAIKRTNPMMTLRAYPEASLAGRDAFSTEAWVIEATEWIKAL